MKILVTLFLLLAFQQTFAQWESCSGTLSYGSVFFAEDLGDVQIANSGFNWFITSDKGKTWPKFQFDSLNITAIISTFNDALYLNYEKGYVSYDRGFTWTKIGDSFPGALSSILQAKDKAYAVSTEGYFLSKDSCKTWTKIEFDFDDTNHEYRFYLSGENVILAGGLYYACSSNYGEDEWNISDTLRGLSSFSEHNGKLYAINYSVVYCSEDHGKTYKNITDNSLNGNFDKIIAYDEGAVIFSIGSPIYKYDAASHTYSELPFNFNGDRIYQLTHNNGRILGWGDRDVYDISIKDTSWTLFHDRTLGNGIDGMSITGNKLYSNAYSGLYLTEDYGTTWSKISANVPSADFYNIYANEKVVITSAVRDTMYLSYDDGKNWETINPAWSGIYKNVFSICADEDNIYVGKQNSSTGHGEIYRTPMNEIYWEKSPFNTAVGNIVAMDFVGDNLFIAQQKNGIYSTTDQGNTWEEKYKLPPNVNLSDMSIWQNTIVAACGDHILISEDGGETWTNKIHNLGKNVSLSYIHVSGNLILASSYTAIYVSTDKGTSFKQIMDGIPQEEGANVRINCVKIFGDYLFAGTSFGPFRGKIADFGITSAQEVVAGLNTFNVYPNPTSDFIVVKSDIGQAFNSDISIYDMQGNIVLQVKSNNSEIQRIEVSSLPTGAYWVRRGSESKMIIKN